MSNDFYVVENEIQKLVVANQKGASKQQVDKINEFWLSYESFKRLMIILENKKMA